MTNYSQRDWLLNGLCENEVTTTMITSGSKQIFIAVFSPLSSNGWSRTWWKTVSDLWRLRFPQIRSCKEYKSHWFQLSNKFIKHIFYINRLVMIMPFPATCRGERLFYFSRPLPACLLLMLGWLVISYSYPLSITYPYLSCT